MFFLTFCLGREIASNWNTALPGYFRLASICTHVRRRAKVVVSVVGVFEGVQRKGDIV